MLTVFLIYPFLYSAVTIAEVAMVAHKRGSEEPIEVIIVSVGVSSKEPKNPAKNANTTMHISTIYKVFL